MKRIARHSTAMTLLLSAGAVFAQAAPQEAPAAPAAVADAGTTGRLDAVIVTGTRTTGVKVEDSASPIQVLDATAITTTGEPDLMQAMGKVLPSLQVEAFASDAAALTMQARLRGLSPNDTLVLINGKRRHTTANLTVDTGSPYIGAAGADLSLIPTAAISRLEVLTDGAAAQYGTDAIAGVVNIILKRDDHGGTIGTEVGGYLDEGGRSGDVSGNFGFKPFDNAFANLTLEARYHGYSDRGATDPRVFPQNLSGVDLAAVNFPGYPHVNHVLGDPSVRTELMTLNSGYDISDDMSLYSVLTYGHKVGLAYENYRLPSKVPGLYPNGFNPSEGVTENDVAFTLGLKSTSFGWNWDASASYGRDVIDIGTYNTFNPAIYSGSGPSQQNFQDGAFHTVQWTNTLDVSRDFEVGWSKPLNVAFGLEQRTDDFELDAGEPSSRVGAGPSSYPGFQLTDAGIHARSNEAIYIDLAGNPVKDLSIDLAGRAEHFSDFGGTSVGKLTARYDFTPEFALRGTVSSGFRAPTLLEEFYSATNVGPLTAYVQLPPNSPAAGLVGIHGLKPEKSDNLSFGAVLHPSNRSSMSVDAYQITIRDRIVGSGNVFGFNAFNGLGSSAVVAAIAANGNVLDPAVVNSPDGQTGINIFSNAADTRTRGVEFVSSLNSNYGDMGRVDWSFAGSYNITKVTSINQAPAQIAPQKLLDLTAISQLETASPRWRLSFDGLWHYENWTFDLKEDYYGESSDYELSDDAAGDYFKDTIKAKFITSVSVSNKITKSVTITVGANNLFNQYPDKKNPLLQASYNAAQDNTAVLQYPNFAPFGINGGFYYARATYSF